MFVSGQAWISAGRRVNHVQFPIFFDQPILERISKAFSPILAPKHSQLALAVWQETAKLC